MQITSSVFRAVIALTGTFILAIAAANAARDYQRAAIVPVDRALTTDHAAPVAFWRSSHDFLMDSSRLDPWERLSS